MPSCWYRSAGVQAYKCDRPDIKMPYNIEKVELETLRYYHGQILNWDSDVEKGVIFTQKV